MYEIKCPNCGEVFQVERAAYAEIVEQVRNEQFNTELEERIRTVREKMEAEQRATLMLQEQELKDKSRRNGICGWQMIRYRICQSRN